MNISQPFVSSENCFFYWFLVIFPLISYTCADQYSAEDLMGCLCRSLELSLYVALSSLVLCPVNYSCLGLPGFPALSLQLQMMPRLLLGSFPPVLLPGNSLGRKLGKLQVHFICFPSLRDHCLALSDVQCLKTIVSYIFVLFFLVVSGRRVNLRTLRRFIERFTW